MTQKHLTPLLDELEKGPWPSFVDDVKRMAQKNEMCQDWLGLMEMSYRDKEGHWKHGGVVGVLGYGGGVIGRYCDRPDLFPNVAHFHTLRVNQPAGKFYSTEVLRKLCDLWEARGSGLTNMHGSTGDIILLGTPTDQLEPLFHELTHDLEMDLGGSGSSMRTPEGCVGKARCEWACLDTLDLVYNITMEYQDALHRPMFPYKFKIKASGCPCDCVGAIARSDCSIIGTWRDNIRVDQEAVLAYVKGELIPHAGAQDSEREPFDIQAEVIDLCPSQCLEWDGAILKIRDEDCTRCMHCIRVMPRALRPGIDTGATVLVGAKAPILKGAQLSSVVIPFLEMAPPYTEFKEFLEKMLDFWMENGKDRERLGEMIQRIGLPKLLKACELAPDPRMVNTPRYNPYIFYDPLEVPGGWERDEASFRKRHQP
jgi:sulfite reductase alpha subunit